MKTPHKHAELIKAWADGAEIECYCSSVDKWHYHANPMWVTSLEYRVKPKVKWTPRYRLITACEDGICTDVAVPKAVCNYYIIQQFVEEFESDWDNQRYEVLIRDKGNKYTAVDRLPSRTLGTLRMSKECAEKLCKMLNNGDVEL